MPSVYDMYLIHWNLNNFHTSASFKDFRQLPTRNFEWFIHLLFWVFKLFITLHLQCTYIYSNMTLNFFACAEIVGLFWLVDKCIVCVWWHAVEQLNLRRGGIRNLWALSLSLNLCLVLCNMNSSVKRVPFLKNVYVYTTLMQLHFCSFYFLQ